MLSDDEQRRLKRLRQLIGAVPRQWTVQDISFVRVMLPDLIKTFELHYSDPSRIITPTKHSASPELTTSCFTGDQRNDPEFTIEGLKAALSKTILVLSTCHAALKRVNDDCINLMMRTDKTCMGVISKETEKACLEAERLAARHTVTIENELKDNELAKIGYLSKRIERLENQLKALQTTVSRSHR